MHQLARHRWLRLRTPAAGALLALLISVVWLGTLIFPSDEAVKVRNAFILKLGEPGDFQWGPESTPATFRKDPGPATEEFTRIASSILDHDRLTADYGLEVGVAIAKRLMGSPTFVGNPIQADNATAYRAITADGRGYCADFTQVFNSIAIAADLPVREWSLSFAAFGAGHAFNEVFDRRRGKWVLLDSFHSLYFVDPSTREPLSVLEVHDRLLNMQGGEGLEIVRIVPDRFPFRSTAIALDYYRRGMAELAMVWGVNPFEYETYPPVRYAAQVSRSLGQLTAIAFGVYPIARIYPKGVNDREYREMERTKVHFFLALLSCIVSALIVSWRLLSRSRPGDDASVDARPRGDA